MKQFKRTSLAVASLLAVGLSPTAYSSVLDGTAIELRSSTLGGGGEINYAFNSMFTAGLGFNRYTIGLDQTANDVDYKSDLKLQTLSLLGSYHPFEGVFRITGGLMLNGNEFTMSGKPSVKYTIGDKTYTGAEVGSLNASVKFNSLAPYFGFGWGKSARSGFGVTADIGVLFQGAPKVSMNANGSVSKDAQFISNLKKEEAAAQEDLKAFDIYPVVAFGLDYRF